jgi:hypothetical protein
MSAAPDTTALLEALGHLLRQVTRLTGGADDGPPMTATQRIALVELGQEARSASTTSRSASVRALPRRAARSMRWRPSVS